MVRVKPAWLHEFLEVGPRAPGFLLFETLLGGQHHLEVGVLEELSLLGIPKKPVDDADLAVQTLRGLSTAFLAYVTIILGSTRHALYTLVPRTMMDGDVQFILLFYVRKVRTPCHLHKAI